MAKNRVYTLHVNGNVYTASKRAIKNTRETAKDAFVRDNVNGIFCVTKGDVVQMVSEVYDTKELMMISVEHYENTGFRVFYTAKEDSNE